MFAVRLVIRLNNEKRTIVEVHERNRYLKNGKKNVKEMDFLLRKAEEVCQMGYIANFEFVTYQK